MNDTVSSSTSSENLRKYKRMPLGEVIDMSINGADPTIITNSVLALMARGVRQASLYIA